MTAGRLYVVGTPIGNLGDLSPRALEILGEVDLIAAEDTRVTRKLTGRAAIKTRLSSYHDGNAARVGPRLIERLRSGANVALVSDAGTPCLSDPGYRLVRAAAEAGIAVVTVPGPSALTALLSIAGLPTDRFLFEGFLPPRGAARQRAIERLRDARCTVVVYESPRRVVSLLGDIARICDDPPVAVGRELTKLHEEVLRGRASEVAAALGAKGPRGEFVIAILISSEQARALDGRELDAEVERLLEQGLSVRDAAAKLKQHGIARRSVYAAARRIRR